MKLRSFLSVFFVLNLLFLWTSSPAAQPSKTIRGWVYLADQLDHAGTAVFLSPISPPSVPAVTWLSLGLLALGLLLLGGARGRRLVRLPLVLFAVAGIVWASMQTVSDSSGKYEFSGALGIGTYRVDFTCDGYGPESLEFEITASASSIALDPVTLYPLAASPTPTPTTSGSGDLTPTPPSPPPTAVETPTVTQTSTPTSTMTATATATSTRTPSPTLTPTATPTFTATPTWTPTSTPTATSTPTSPPATGNLYWAVQAGHYGQAFVRGLSVNPLDGTSIVSGYYYGKVVFARGEPAETSLSSAGGGDVFIAKYAADGSMMWVQGEGGTGYDCPHGVEVFPNGDFVVVGYFHNTVVFGAGLPNQTSLTSVGGSDIFIVKYDAGGQLLWARQAGGASYDAAMGVAYSSQDGSLFMTGYIQGTAVFGQGEPGQTTLASAGSSDIFVALYSADGSLVWARRAGGSGYDYGSGAVWSELDGTFSATGLFQGSAIFGSGEPGETPLTAEGGTDIFVAKYAFDGSLAWAASAGGFNYDYGYDLAVDSVDGSLVATGIIQGTATFGAGEAGEVSLTSAGYEDLFVAKYSSGGTLSWAKRAGGSNSDYGESVAIDQTGSILVTGEFRGTAVFGPGEAGQVLLPSAGGYDLFAAKYTSEGLLAWAKSAGGMSSDYSYGVALSQADDSLRLAGNYYGTATFGAGEPSEVILGPGGTEVFVAKLGLDGSVGWASEVTAGGGSDAGQAMALSPLDGTVVVTGFFEGNALYGAGEPGETTLTSAGGYDIFLVRTNPDGTLLWAKRAGGPLFDYGYDLALNSVNDTIVVVGSFNATALFGEGEAGEASLTSAGNEDVFLATYNGDGTLAWVRRAGGSGYDSARGVASIASDGSSIVTGYFYGSTLFGAGEVNETTLNSAGSYDLFIAKYDALGSLVWAKRAGGYSSDSATGVSAGSDGSCVVVGEFSGFAIFGAGETGETTLYSSGGKDLFVAKYNPDGTLLWAKRAGGSSTDSAVAVAVNSADGSSVVVGSFYGTALFGTGGQNEISLSSAGGKDLFVVKYDPDGILSWAMQAGGTGSDYASDVAFSQNEILVTGIFESSAVFGAGDASETWLVSAGGTDFFVAEYKSDGSLDWAKGAGGSSYDFSRGVAANDVSNVVVVTGEFSSTAIFGSGEPGQTSLAAAGGNDAFVAKYHH